MLIYAAIGAVGLIFLLAMLFVGEIFGGDHDVHAEGDAGGHGVGEHAEAAGPSIFSARVMAAFLTAFGGGGVIARYYRFSHPVASGIGVASGLVLAAVVYQFARLLYSQQASSEVRMAGLIGRTAEVTVGIPEGGVGQVTLTYAGERTTQIARAADGGAIPLGAEVTVTALRGDSIVVARGGSPAPGGRT